MRAGGSVARCTAEKQSVPSTPAICSSTSAKVCAGKPQAHSISTAAVTRGAAGTLCAAVCWHDLPSCSSCDPIAAACRHDMPSCCSCDPLTDCNLCLQGAGQTIKHLPPLEARLGHAAGAPVSGKVCLDLIRKAGSISGMWERAAGYDSSDFGGSGSALHPNFVTDHQGFAHLC